ncbi:hypothetical protein MOV08_16605 [Streptomyces yunnanensis]|uniref:VanZ like family protein n=1 Tax=Streptomyces yunnanensis TaxID=156453 RepID=A0ABY8A7S0_9ACTN|nr:hypothetical protein [Streptomyces yunnanensis]WEB40741.1 hypothetical protein MOV08_16605 [Streptomyces yunnanensis]
MSSTAHALVMAALGAAAILAGLPAWRPLVRRRGWPPVPTLLFLVTCGLCVGITLPDQIAPGVVGRTLAPVRDCQPADWAHNTLGIAVGALLG